MILISICSLVPSLTTYKHRTAYHPDKHPVTSLLFATYTHQISCHPGKHRVPSLLFATYTHATEFHPCKHTMVGIWDIIPFNYHTH